MNIILGSASKWRQQILKDAGFVFEIIHADIDEQKIRHDDPKQLVIDIANAKAEAILLKTKTPAILITVDQVVACNSEIFEKPTSASQVQYFCEQYNNHNPQTITGIVVINTTTGKKAEGVDVTTVYFNHIPPQEINRIIKEGEIFHCAGGFQIEGANGKINPYIDHFDGSTDSVKGLPMKLLKKLIAEVK
jgi:septum formation protein